VAVSFIGGGNRTTRRKPLTFRKIMKIFIPHDVLSSTPLLSEIRTHNISGGMYWLHS
jgi:hypothetical protein